MRVIYTLWLLLIFSVGTFSQPVSDTSVLPAIGSIEKALQSRMGCGIVVVALQKKNVPDTTVKIRSHCQQTLTSDNEPLFIIDGLPVRGKELSTLKPENIDSIWILKNAAATAIYGSEGSNGVIIISTKKSTDQKLIIKNFLDGRTIPGATVSFISANKKDTLYFVANDSGVIVANKLKQSAEYEMSVSSIGYTPINQNFRNGNGYGERNILLSREIINCEEVIVKFSPTRSNGCGWGYLRCGIQGVDITIVSDKSTIGRIVTGLKIYPNPLQKGTAFNFQFNIEDGTDKTVRVLSMDGKIMLQQTLKGYQGKDLLQVRADARWAAGTYFIQLVYENGQVLASDKLIIQ